jgi:hypothetical protein
VSFRADCYRVRLLPPVPNISDPAILWKSTTLADGSWQKVTDAVVTESNGQLTLTDSNPGTTRAFYRVQRDIGL